MRDVVTTALEVVGMLLICAAVGLAVGSAVVALAAAGVVLVVVGVLEARR